MWTFFFNLMLVSVLNNSFPLLFVWFNVLQSQWTEKVSFPEHCNTCFSCVTQVSFHWLWKWSPTLFLSFQWFKMEHNSSKLWCLQTYYCLLNLMFSCSLLLWFQHVRKLDNVNQSCILLNLIGCHIGLYLFENGFRSNSIR